MRELTVLRPGSLLAYETSWAQLRMPTRCSASSRASMPCLCGHTSVVPSESTRRSWSREWKMTSNLCMRSSKCSTHRAELAAWADTGICLPCQALSSGPDRFGFMHGFLAPTWKFGVNEGVLCKPWIADWASAECLYASRGGRPWERLGAAPGRTKTEGWWWQLQTETEHTGTLWWLV